MIRKCGQACGAFWAPLAVVALAALAFASLLPATIFFFASALITVFPVCNLARLVLDLNEDSSGNNVAD
jgi:hypothetical protein